MSDVDVKMHNGRVVVSAGYETVNISYFETIVGNAEEAVPIVVCHGFTSSKELLEATFLKHLIQEASEAGLNLRILALDWPGHGLSGELKKYSFKILRETLRAFMDKMDIERAHIFGMSLGGVISIMFAARYPSRVMTLTPVGAPIDSRDLDFGAGFKQAVLGHRAVGILGYIVPKRMKFVPEEFVRKVASIVASSGPPEATKDFKVAFKDEVIHQIVVNDLRNFSAQAYFDCAKEFLKLRLFDELRSIHNTNTGQIPVLILDGELPGYRFLDTADRIHLRLNSDLTEKFIIKGVGHLAIILKPEEASTGYVDFLLKTRNIWESENLKSL